MSTSTERERLRQKSRSTSEACWFGNHNECTEFDTCTCEHHAPLPPDPNDPLQVLATQLESQAATLARVVGERDRLRETVLKLGYRAADGSGPCWCGADDRVFGHSQRCKSIRGIVNPANATPPNKRKDSSDD